MLRFTVELRCGCTAAYTGQCCWYILIEGVAALQLMQAGADVLCDLIGAALQLVLTLASANV